MSTTVVMDRAGRVVIPKNLRKELQLEPGDSLSLERIGDQITLSPEREGRRLIKKHGFWVMQGTGETLPASIGEEILDKIRREREATFVNQAG